LLAGISQKMKKRDEILKEIKNFANIINIKVKIIKFNQNVVDKLNGEVIFSHE